MKDQDTVYSWLFALQDAAAVYQDGVICASNDAFKMYWDSDHSAVFEWIKNNENKPLERGCERFGWQPPCDSRFKKQTERQHDTLYAARRYRVGGSKRSSNDQSE